MSVSSVIVSRQRRMCDCEFADVWSCVTGVRGRMEYMPVCTAYAQSDHQRRPLAAASYA